MGSAIKTDELAVSYEENSAKMMMMMDLCSTPAYK